MTGRRKIQLHQLLAVIVTWQIVAILIVLYDHFLIHSDYTTIDKSLYSFPAYLVFNMMAALIGSLVGGSLIIFWINEKFLDRPYGQSILAVVFIFLVLTTLLVIILGVFFIYYTRGIPPGDERFWEQYSQYLFKLFHLKKLLVWSVVIAFTQLALQMDRKFGHGVLWKIILGKYHFPKEEHRIFMFADLNDSTTIAESVGHIKYHSLLRHFFADVTNAIIDNDGSIYKYVGDQVIVSWDTKKKGAANCIRCFFDMKQSIENKKDFYLKNFGLVPQFKAGIHLGNVVAGEIGIIRRDITYSGDVLNTTSRIQDMCGKLNADIIVSDELLTAVPLSSRFSSRYIGNIMLKGKKNETRLHAIARVDVKTG